jgi:hypothetical protein
MERSAEATARWKRALEAVSAPLPEEESDYRIATLVGPAYLAKSRSNLPTLLIPLQLVHGVVGRRGGGFSLSPVNSVVFEYGERRWEQPAATLECTESSLLDVFLILVFDIASRIDASKKEVTWQSIVTWVEEWQALFARRAALTIEQQLGLWGELWVIANAVDVDSLIAAWRGPEYGATDFFLGGVALEVKVSRQPHVHHISQRQVDRPVGQYPSYILSIWLGIDPKHGISLAELVDMVLARASNAALVLRRIGLLGYAPLDRDQYATRLMPLEIPYWFEPEDVPRVRSIDTGISHLRYTASLDVSRAIPEEKAQDLWEHFCKRRLGFPASLSTL